MEALNIIFEPSPEILEICDLVDKSIEAFLALPVRIPSGEFEHEVTASLNINHSIRMLESITELARKDLVLVQSSLVISRSIFEGLVKTCWILLPNDKFSNESRFISHLQSELEYWNKLRSMFQSTENSLEFQKHRYFDEFIRGVTSLLKEKGYLIPKMPNFRDMLKEFKKEALYSDYMLLSQFSHLSHYSSSIYQSNLGVSKTFEEKPNIDLWKHAFRISLPIFHFATQFFIASLGNAVDIYDQGDIDRFSELVSQS